ncbi:MAG: DUF4115 domain-containing protein [Betaproteobacteria bacterium]|nr:DUF4115 domain-containing protein [Betaproteobacteria bacterium]
MIEQAGIGAEMARAREALGLSTADVAQQLKFSARQIEALEQDRYESLPTGTFARGMVRAYARLLKLDAEGLVGRIAVRVVAPDNTAAMTSVSRAIAITDSAWRSNLTYVALSLALLVVIAGVAIEWQQERARAAQISLVQAADQAQHAPAASVAASSVVAPPPLAPSSEGEPANQVAGTAAPAPGSRRLLLLFERDSWVEVRGRGGKLLLSRLNAAGSQRRVDGEAPFQLIIGNARHVRLSYDDRPLDLAPHLKGGVARFTLE